MRVVAVGAAVLGIVWLFVFTKRSQREALQFQADAAKSHEAIAAGNFARARQVLWRWAEQTTLPRASALARHNLAWTLMRQGELQQSLDIHLHNDSHFARSLKVMGMRPTSSVDIALNYALLGNLELAEKWMALATEHSKGLHSPSFPAMQIFSRAVIECRAGRFDEAVRILDDNWSRCEALFTGDCLRPLRVIRAFAIASADPRSAGIAQSMVALSRPPYPGEYDFLGVEWPEMAAFLTTHDLASRERTTSSSQ